MIISTLPNTNYKKRVQKGDAGNAICTCLKHFGSAGWPPVFSRYSVQIKLSDKSMSKKDTNRDLRIETQVWWNSKEMSATIATTQLWSIVHSTTLKSGWENQTNSRHDAKFRTQNQNVVNKRHACDKVFYVHSDSPPLTRILPEPLRIMARMTLCTVCGDKGDRQEESILLFAQIDTPYICCHWLIISGCWINQSYALQKLSRWCFCITKDKQVASFPITNTVNWKLPTFKRR